MNCDEIFAIIREKREKRKDRQIIEKEKNLLRLESISRYGKNYD
tara:strand:+ start:2529 stop:2660 length:132 start_codon:yes stop_codon:yes gene_type:complete